MTQKMVQVLLSILLIVLVAGVEATPPGIAKNPSHATCKIKKYKHCYNLVHVCPKFCPDECTVECASCKPICVGGTNPPPNSPTPSTPNYPPPPSSTPSPSPPTPSTPRNPPPSSPSPATPVPSTPPTTKPPSPSPPSSTPSPTPPAGNGQSSPPKNPPPSSPTPSSTKPPSPLPPSSSSPKTARCGNKNYPKCYNTDHVCPSACPGGCQVDCNTCKPVCKCDKPGAVCQDPRFIGGDGITFYFHGKKDNNFCLISDPNLHINAHFIGRRNENMKRDFTWVQSIAILFDNHQLFIGAQKTTTWDDSVDHLALNFDGEPITLQESKGATWKSLSVSIVREVATNNIIVEVVGRFKITAKVVPITEEDSRIHKYGITKDDCFAHLDLGFKFFSLTDQVSGVLGQTYKPNYVSHVDIGAKMPVMGGGKEYETTSLFSPDCSVARFVGNNETKNDIAMVTSQV